MVTKQQHKEIIQIQLKLAKAYKAGQRRTIKMWTRELTEKQEEIRNNKPFIKDES
jgi:hypothetical protein